MEENGSDDSYKPGIDFEKDNRAPALPISLSDSTELWLIQCPINQLKPAEFHGKKLSLKLHRDGKLAKFESSSGKSYEVVSFAAQEPNATVFLPSSSNSKVVGKISRRVCLVRYPEPGEFDQQNGLRLQGSMLKSLSHLSSYHNNGSQAVADRPTETLTCGLSTRQGILETPAQQSRKKKHRDAAPGSESTMFVGRSSLASQPESQATVTTTGSTPSHTGKSKMKKHKS